MSDRSKEKYRQNSRQKDRQKDRQTDGSGRENNNLLTEMIDGLNIRRNRVAYWACCTSQITKRQNPHLKRQLIMIKIGFPDYQVGEVNRPYVGGTSVLRPLFRQA